MWLCAVGISVGHGGRHRPDFLGRKATARPVGGQNLEKGTERSCWESSGMSSGEIGEWRFPRPPISMLGLPVRQVPFLQTFVLSGTIWGGGVPNVEIGARGNALLLRQKSASRDFCFIFSKYCPPPVDHGPRFASSPLRGFTLCRASVPQFT